MWKKYALATIAYVLISMAIAMPWHLFWFHDTYVAMGAMTRPAANVPLGMATMVVQGFVLAVLYARWHPAGNPILAGIKFNLFAGLLIYTVQGPATAAKMDINPIATFLAYHTAFQFLQLTATGAALGAIFGTAPVTASDSAPEGYGHAV